MIWKLLAVIWGTPLLAWLLLFVVPRVFDSGTAGNVLAVVMVLVFVSAVAAALTHRIQEVK